MFVQSGAPSVLPTPLAGGGVMLFDDALASES
jgi:hypothetical protein